MEEYEAYIDQLPAKLIKTLEEADGHPPSEETLREIYEAHKELKRNVKQLKEELNDKMEKMQILGERIKTEKDANALDLVTELMQSCGIPDDEEIDDTLSNDSNESNTVSEETNETNKSIDVNEANDCTDWEDGASGIDWGDGACGIDFKQIEEMKERNVVNEGNSSKLPKLTYNIEEV